MSKQRPKAYRWLYRLSPAPPKWEYQDYIAAYLQDHDEQYLAWFLHYYEWALQKKAEDAEAHYFMPGHAEDIKQVYVAGLLKALEAYDIERGVPFLVFKEYYLENELQEYIRTMRTGYTAKSPAEHRKLRRAMATWDKYRRGTDTKTIETVAGELGETIAETRDILRAALVNENRFEPVYNETDSDDENVIEDIFVDTNSDVHATLMRRDLHRKLWEAYDALSYTERLMLSQHLGFCFDCHSVFYIDHDDLDAYGEPKKKRIKPMPYTDIATAHGLSSAATPKRKIEKALGKLREAIN